MAKGLTSCSYRPPKCGGTAWAFGGQTVETNEAKTKAFRFG